MKLEFLVVGDDGEEALLSLDTLKDLSIVHREFPLPMDRSKREPKIRRVRDPNCEEVSSISDANKLVENHKEIQMYKAKTPIEIPAYLEPAKGFICSKEGEGGGLGPLSC